MVSRIPDSRILTRGHRCRDFFPQIVCNAREGLPATIPSAGPCTDDRPRLRTSTTTTITATRTLEQSATICSINEFAIWNEKRSLKTLYTRTITIFRRTNICLKFARIRRLRDLEIRLTLNCYCEIFRRLDSISIIFVVLFLTNDTDNECH